MIGSWELQKAIFSALVNADVADGKIYDHTPPGAVTPYVVFGESQPIKANVQRRSGVEETKTLHIWSRYRGQKELLEIGAAIELALDQQNLEVDGRETAFVNVVGMRTMEDPDGLTQHGIVTLLVHHFGTQET